MTHAPRDFDARPVQLAGILAACLAALALTALAAPAHAQNAGETSQTQQVAEHADDEDQTEWKLGLGSTLNTGNTRSFAGSASSRFLIKRGRHRYTLDVLGVVGYASLRDGATGTFGDWVPNTGNINATTRYDFFITSDDALFVGAVARRDTFAGLDLRAQVQIGYLRYFVHEEKHRFWGEVGADLTYDDFFYDAAQREAARMAGTTLPADLVQPSARLYLGYDNKLSDAATIVTGVEGLFDFTDFNNFRLNWLSEFRSKIGGNFQLSLAFALRFDGVPPEGKNTLDTTTILSVLYTLI
jgi:putative salt-induced outer membrane protein YdiY